MDQMTKEVLLERLNRLQYDTPRKWGKMDAAQMLAHLQVSLEQALGKRNLKQSVLGKLFGTWIKNFMIHSNRPFQKNLPTDKSFIVADPKNFELEKSKLVGLLNEFYAIDASKYSPTAHPIFGDLTFEEWDVLFRKHMNHHLTQFNV
ncbi:MAG: DUF1569 domain-containing protein [Chitinophagales bacterium]|nr:DUF1569 domain-containing protein [Chitinophagales bacterium]